MALDQLDVGLELEVGNATAGLPLFETDAMRECEAGCFKDVNGSAACTLCLQGKYSTATAAIFESTCSNRPSHTYSGAGSGLLTNCTCNKGYTGPDGVACMACIAGTYKDVNGSSPCSLCSQGKYSAETGEILESTCIECPAYTHSPDGSSMLTSCTCNKGYTGADGDQCQPCIAGSYKSVLGTAACVSCVAGKYSTTVAAAEDAVCLECQRHSVSASGREMCLCNAGYSGSGYSGSESFSGGNTTCSACVVGTFKVRPGNVECDQCPINTYSDIEASDSDSCVYCPSNSISPAGSSNYTDCKCKAGYTGHNGGECIQCEAGKYKSVLGSHACIDCQANSAAAPGSEFCACNAGYSLSAPATCSPCKKGTYKSSWGTESCTECPAGLTTEGAGATSPSCLCDAGYTGNGPCIACKPGSYKSQMGSTPCTVCQGLRSSEEAATSADMCFCNAGYTDVGGSCAPCEAGKFSNAEKSTCIACPERSTSKEGSDTCVCEDDLAKSASGKCVHV